jgi:hypothetical protein
MIQTYPDISKISYPFPIVFYDNVDINGFDFPRIIIKHITKNYERACYFCCGKGATGFYLLNNQQVKHMTFVDHYQPALDGCKITAQINGWLSNCKFLNVLPNEGLIDVFVADPPWWPEILPGAKVSQHHLRQCFDVGYATHKTMWSWLDQHLSEDGDIFITRDRLRIDLDWWYELIPKSFKVVAEHELKFFLGRENKIKIVNSSTLVHLSRRRDQN